MKALTPNTEDFNYFIEMGNAEASTSIPIAAGQLKKGGFIVLRDRPCKISELSTSAPGKHGHSKCTIVAQDLFNQKKFETILPSHHIAYVPIVNKADYTLLDITEDGFCTLLSDDGTTREDISLPLHPEGLSKRIHDAFLTGDQLIVTVVDALRVEQIVSFKSDEKHT